MCSRRDECSGPLKLFLGIQPSALRPLYLNLAAHTVRRLGDPTGANRMYRFLPLSSPAIATELFR
jgi:hypothetical protein